MLETPGAPDKLQADILEFYNWNKGSSKVTILWDACKAFLRGKLIALKAFRDKEKNSARVKLKLEIERLESETKQDPVSNNVKPLDATYDALKLLDAQEILSGKQKLFEC